MKRVKGYVCLSAAIGAVLGGQSVLRAAGGTLSWAPDTTGNWDTVTPNWLDSVGVPVTWSNALPNSAYFGSATQNATVAPGALAFISENISVQDIFFGTAASGATFNISDLGDSGQTLTWAGNFNKVANKGQPQFFLSNKIVLTGNEHVISLNDTPDNVAEITFTTGFTGSGSLTFDNEFNNSGYEQYGTAFLTAAGNYTGGTNIKSGRVAITDASALGGGSINISNAGVLTIGANFLPSVSQPHNLTIANAINISRDTYTGAAFDKYNFAFRTENGTGTTTLSGLVTLASNDAKVIADSSTLVINNGIVQANVGSLNVLELGGDTAGHIYLRGNNTGVKGGIVLGGNVELHVENEQQLTGSTSTLTFNGGVLNPVGGFLQNFGAHAINAATFSGGIDVDENQSFTVDRALGPNDTTTNIGNLSKRGLGTLNINNPVNLRGGQSYYDAGVVNVNSTLSIHSIHTRSVIFNIGTGGFLTTANNYSSFGQDSFGTNGGPDISTVNVFGTGQAAFGDNDLNVSDNANTAGTLNVSDAGRVTVAGWSFFGRNAGATGKLNITGNGQFISGRGYFGFVGGTGLVTQSSGSLIFTRGDDHGMTIGDNNGNAILSTATFNKSGGYTSVAGELFVGNAQNNGDAAGLARGTVNMSGGSMTVNNWLVVGRQRAVGTINLSGGTLTKQGGGNFLIGDGDNGGLLNAVLVSNNAVLNIAPQANDGESWIGQAAQGSLTVQDSGSFITNSWTNVGRVGGSGTLNLNDNAKFTKQGGGNFIVADNATGNMFVRNNAVVTLATGEVWIGQGGGSNGSLTVQDSGSLTANGLAMIGRDGGNGYMFVRNNAVVNFTTNDLWVGQNGGSNGSLTIENSGAVTVNNWLAVGRAGGNGTITLSGGTLTKQGVNNTVIGAGGAGRVIQTGGALNLLNTIVGETSTGTLAISGGTSNFTGLFRIGQNSGVVGNMSVSGTSTVALPDVLVGFEAGAGGGVLNLNGGTTSVNSIAAGAASGNKVLNLNGGLLRARSDNAAWIAGLSTVNVGAGGARIDTAGFAVATPMGLTHDVTLGGTADLGLVKTGAGTLQIGGVSNYTGATTVVAGALSFTNDGVTNAHTPILTNSAGVDIQGGRVVLAYSGTATSPVTTVDGLLTTSYNNNAFINTTAQIRSTTANATIGLGYFDNGTNVTVARTYYGDANVDGVVDTVDFARLIAGFGNTAAWSLGDFNYDNVVNSVDFGKLVLNYGSPALGALPGALPGTTPGVFDSARPGALVPEPTTFGVLGFALGGLIRRRRAK